MIEAALNAPIANSFGVAAKATKTIILNSEQQLPNLCEASTDGSYLILGGASNILLTKDFDGLVIRNALLGIRINDVGGSRYNVTCGAGENWADFVDIMVAKGLFGLENLSLIPGSVGASPIQNIGAYGVEMQQCFSTLKAFSLITGKKRIFTKQDCAFAYRDSIFKRNDMREWLITEVSFLLDTKPTLELGYGELKTEASKLALERGVTTPSATDVAQAVKAIRRSKLPDPAVLGNAGSFFKNPIVPTELIEQLKRTHPAIPSYPVVSSKTQVKTSAGWLIDQAGWKGFRRGDAGVHKDHALVLVNYGQASGAQIWQLACDIQAGVRDKFGIAIEPEPILI
jgi:UDP-N-acetylmuramate dehydrogenase